MNIYNEIFPYVQLVLVLVSCVLAVSLVCAARNLVGRGWLIASTVITLVTWPGHLVLSILARYSADAHETYRWFSVLNLPSLFGTACFALFLLANWSRSRMQLDLRSVLFSFSGRLPRSVFWIMICIMFPLGTTLGFAPFTSDAHGLPLGIIWTVYVVWCILGTWISLAVYTKRWHDCGKSGWMSLILLIPIVGPFWFLGCQGFVKGPAETNQYGDNPLNLPPAPPAP